MAIAPTLISISDYLSSSFHPDVHFVEGELEERNAGEYEHGKTQSLISAFFEGKAAEWSTDVIVEQRVRVRQNRVRVADVVVLGPEAPYERVTATPPLLCIEVLSPEDRLSRAELVMADYRAMGVENIWLIDPIRRVAYTFDQHGTQRIAGTKLTVPGTPIALDLSTLFASLDAAIGRRKMSGIS